MSCGPLAAESGGRRRRALPSLESRHAPSTKPCRGQAHSSARPVASPKISTSPCRAMPGVKTEHAPTAGVAPTQPYIVGQGASRISSRDSNNAPLNLDLRFEDAEIRDVATTILGDILKKPYVDRHDAQRPRLAAHRAQRLAAWLDGSAAAVGQRASAATSGWPPAPTRSTTQPRARWTTRRSRSCAPRTPRSRSFPCASPGRRWSAISSRRSIRRRRSRSTRRTTC